MSDGTVNITAGTGTPIDVSTVTTGSGTVDRQRVVIGGDVGTDGLVKVINGGLSVIASDVTQAISVAATATNVSLATQGKQSASVVITGTWVGTFVFEVSVDGAVWVGVDVFSEASESWVQSTTANGSWWFEALGAINAVRIRSTAWTSGTATGTILASNQASGTFEYQAGLGAAVPPNAVYVAGTDGTNLRGLSVDSGGVLAFKRKPDATSTFAPTNVDSTALEASHVLKASAGVLYGFTGYSARTTSQFIQVHNATSLPADTAVPLVVIFIPAGPVSFSWDAPAELGKFFSTGMVICNSSTGPTKTLGAADCWFNCSIA